MKPADDIGSLVKAFYFLASFVSNYVRIYHNNTDTSLFAGDKELETFVDMLLEDEKEEDLNNE